MPALLRSTSTLPKRSIAWFTTVTAVRGSRRSPTIVNTAAPFLRHRSAAWSNWLTEPSR
jgi:hypothetical protein